MPASGFHDVFPVQNIGTFATSYRVVNPTDMPSVYFFRGRVRLSRPASACSFSTLRLNLVLTHGIPTDFRGGVCSYRHRPSGYHIIPPIPSDQSRVNRVTQLRTDGVHCLESAGTAPVALKVVPVTGGAFSGIIMDQLMRTSLFPHPLLV